MGAESKICPTCKEQNNPTFEKCWKCLTPLTVQQNSSAQAPSKEMIGSVGGKVVSESMKPMVFFVILVLLLGLAIGYRVFVYKSYDENKNVAVQPTKSDVKQVTTYEMEMLKIQIMKDELELQRKAFEAGQKQASDTEVVRLQKENQLNDCLKNAYDNYNNNWLSICRSKGLLGFSFSTCSLPTHQANRLNMELHRAEKSCAEVYK